MIGNSIVMAFCITPFSSRELALLYVRRVEAAAPQISEKNTIARVSSFRLVVLPCVNAASAVGSAARRQTKMKMFSRLVT